MTLNIFEEKAIANKEKLEILSFNDVITLISKTLFLWEIYFDQN